MCVILTTPRVELCRMDQSDAAFILELLNSPGWLKGIGDRGVRTVDQAQKYITENITKSFEDNGFGLFKMVRKKNNRIIGICGFVQRKYLDYPDLGFAILPEYEGKGLTTETSKGVLDYGFNILNLDKVFGITNPDNFASRHILEKLGFEKLELIIPAPDKDPLQLFSLAKSSWTDKNHA